MKKILLLIMLTTAYMATQAGNGKLGLGIKAGVNNTKLNGNGWVSKYNTSPYGGIFAYLNSYKFGVQAEFLYTTQTVVTASDFPSLYSQYLTQIDSFKKGSYTFNQIQVPLMVNYRINRKFWLQGGAIFTSNIKAIDNNSFFNTTNAIFKNNNIAFFGGIHIALGKKLSLDGRYVLGNANLNNLTSTSYNWTNNAIQAGLGYRLF
jgi:Outer membrane protein beta-barrel domain